MLALCFRLLSTYSYPYRHFVVFHATIAIKEPSMVIALEIDPQPGGEEKTLLLRPDRPLHLSESCSICYP